MAKEIPVPDELKILLPELAKETIVVGSKAYEMMPLTEGQLERVSNDIAAIIEKINSPHGKCPKCGKIVRNALPAKIFECPDDKASLETMNESPMEAILNSSKISQWIELITGIPSEEVKANMTFNQIKHFAGLFWKLNFSEDGLPKESKENFSNLLGMIGMGAPQQAKKEESPKEPKAENPVS